MNQSSPFFRQAQIFLEGQRDEDDCLMLLDAIRSLADKIDPKDQVEAKYFESQLYELAPKIKEILGPRQYQPYCRKINNILDRIINPDNYPPSEENRPGELTEHLPLIMSIFD